MYPKLTKPQEKKLIGIIGMSFAPPLFLSILMMRFGCFLLGKSDYLGQDTLILVAVSGAISIICVHEVLALGKERRSGVPIVTPQPPPFPDEHEQKLIQLIVRAEKAEALVEELMEYSPSQFQVLRARLDIANRDRNIATRILGESDVEIRQLKERIKELEAKQVKEPSISNTLYW